MSQKEDVMTATLVSLLFAAAACLALGAIAASWHDYGPAALSLRQQLAECDPVRELRFVRITTLVRVDNAEVWRPGFRPLASLPRRQGRPQLRHSLRAA
jgi:hypothetical protein